MTHALSRRLRKSLQWSELGEKATRLGEWLFKNMTHVKHRAVL
jgi:hypothetical protein